MIVYLVQRINNVIVYLLIWLSSEMNILQLFTIRSLSITLSIFGRMS